MSDIKLFHTGDKTVTELESQSVAVEKSLQRLMERHLETFLGIRFLASELSTGPTHGGRIDTLGIDENGSPAIIEYKRAINQNVINQGTLEDCGSPSRGDETLILGFTWGTKRTWFVESSRGDADEQSVRA